MVIDTSALFATLGDEPERGAITAAIAAAEVRLLSSPTAVEAGLVALGRKGERGLAELRALVEQLSIETVSFTADHTRLAVEAYRRFGRGRHPAALNFGDCFSYALSRATGEPLLFKGTDFSRTDVVPALRS